LGDLQNPPPEETQGRPVPRLFANTCSAELKFDSGSGLEKPAKLKFVLRIMTLDSVRGDEPVGADRRTGVSIFEQEVERVRIKLVLVSPVLTRGECVFIAKHCVSETEHAVDVIGRVGESKAGGLGFNPKSAGAFHSLSVRAVPYFCVRSALRNG
jgi:hypothetical protein